MINYSVYLTTNALRPKDPPKAYAKNQVNEIWSVDKFAKHIADHNGVYSRGTVRGVLSDMCECLVELLLNGNKIRLGELGTFGISISSEPADTLEKFTSKNIKAVNILFNPGEDFDNLLSRAEFNMVASRRAQDAVLQAEKKMQGILDLNAAKKKGNSASDDTTSGGSTSGGSTSGGSTSRPSDADKKDDGGTGSSPVTPPSGVKGDDDDDAGA